MSESEAEGGEGSSVSGQRGTVDRAGAESGDGFVVVQGSA